MPNLPQDVLGAPDQFITEAFNGRVAPSFFDTAKFLETTLGLPTHAEISPFTMTKDPTFEEVTGCQRALFEWADSYDTKDWERLKKCVAPTLRIDYRSFLDKMWEAMPKDEFIMMASDPRFLGNPLLKTQHFVGLSTWKKVSDDEIEGTHQLRVPHQKYADSSLKEVAVKGHAHGIATMWYKRVEQEWKFAGVCPQIRWSEFDYDKVFAEGKDHFGVGGDNE